MIRLSLNANTAKQSGDSRSFWKSTSNTLVLWASMSHIACGMTRAEKTVARAQTLNKTCLNKIVII